DEDLAGKGDRGTMRAVAPPRRYREQSRKPGQLGEPKRLVGDEDAILVEVVQQHFKFGSHDGAPAATATRRSMRSMRGMEDRKSCVCVLDPSAKKRHRSSGRSMSNDSPGKCSVRTATPACRAARRCCSKLRGPNC